MAFPIDEKGMFNIFTDFEFVKPHKNALVFIDCERLLVQYEAKTGPLSPGFIVPLRTEPGETYVLETRGFLHEGKKAFVYGEARGLTGSNGPTGPTGPTEPTDTAVTGPDGFDQLDEVDAFGNTPTQVPTILGFLKAAPKTVVRNAHTNSREFSSPLSETPTTAAATEDTRSKGCTGSNGCNTRLIPRDYFFKSCEESCFKICFTAKTHCTDVGILFFCNTIDYCLSLSQFLVYKQSSKPGCCRETHGTCCNSSQGPTGSCKDHDVKDPCSPCSPLNSCNSNFMRFNDCCKENICIRTGPTGAQGRPGPTGAPGVSGTRTFCLDIARQGFAGRTLTTLNCSVLGAYFLETGISPATISDAIAKGNKGSVTSNCVKLWQCDGSLFQWIIPDPADYVYYDTDALLLWIVQNQNATLLISNLGDLAVNSRTGDVLIGNSLGQWIFDGCNLRGPTGPAGPTGVGATGIQGRQGITGPTGSPIGSATFTQNILPADFVLIPNSQGSLINFVDIALNASSIPTGTVTTSTFVGPAVNTERKIEIDTSIANILFASSAAPGSLVASGQHISGVLTIDLSTYLLNHGFIPNFIGNPTIQAQVQQDDISINIGYPNNIYASLANNQNQVRFVIVYYNAGPNTVDLSTFQILLNLSVKICGKVALT